MGRRRTCPGMIPTKNNSAADPQDTVTRHPSAPRPAPDWIHIIGCISTGRADAGIYQPLLRALSAEPDWQVVCFAGGTHHAERFGRTLDELATVSGVELVTVDHLIEGDGPVEVAATSGRATEAFARAFADHRPDLVFALGDRTEMLAATLAAVIHKLPIAHLHGGDVTRGAYDDACRHAITKLSHVHFPALGRHADRIAAMGEEPWRIHAVGALALDGLRDFLPEPVGETSDAVGIDLSRPTVMVVFHPETLSEMPVQEQIAEVLAAVDSSEMNTLLIGPNADVGHAAIRSALRRFAVDRPNTVVAASLSQRRFWNCLSRVRLLVGNSSAGIMEAASFRLPVVNIGARQAGRFHGANVIDSPLERKAVAAAIDRGLSREFAAGLDGLVNPYGDGRAAARIVAAMRQLPERETLLAKRGD